MYKTNKRTFDINYREAGRNSYYTAVHTREDGSRLVFTRKSLSSLKSFIEAKGDTFTINFW